MKERNFMRHSTISMNYMRLTLKISSKIKASRHCFLSDKSIRPWEVGYKKHSNGFARKCELWSNMGAEFCNSYRNEGAYSCM